jgi:hypothetical protein
MSGFEINSIGDQAKISSAITLPPCSTSLARSSEERVRFLGQLLPRKTEDENLKDPKDEEARLRAVVVAVVI